jgi:hypothetical protein
MLAKRLDPNQREHAGIGVAPKTSPRVAVDGISDDCGVSLAPSTAVGKGEGVAVGAAAGDGALVRDAVAAGDVLAPGDAVAADGAADAAGDTGVVVG